MSNGAEMSISDLLFSLKGRITRSTYWLKYLLPYLAIFVVLGFVDVAMGSFDAEAGVGLLMSVFALVALYPSIAVAVKRCHDRNRSGWFLLLGLIPFVNLWVLVELWLLRGTKGPNKYGPDPLGASVAA